MKKLILSLLLVVLCMSLFALDKWIPHNLLSGDGTSENPYLVEDFADLTTLSTTSSYWASGTYIQQTGNIDASESSTLNGGEGFIPITLFQGVYDGNNNYISNLNINRSSGNQALFGKCDNATIKNLGLEDCQITGTFYTGALVGEAINSSSIENCYSTGSVNGTIYIGGLIGHINSGTSVESTFSECSVNGTASVGGLIGYSKTNTTLTKSYATGDVQTTGANSGGLVGYAYQMTSISECFATGDVSGDESVGAFGGNMYGTNPSNRLTINNCYASGNVQGTSIVGSFSGRFNRVIVDNCYSLGSITYIESSVGAFTSSAFSTTCTNSFWNSTTAGVATSPIAIGKTSEELRTLATFIDSNWDFVDESANGENDYWTLNSEINDGFPYLTNLEDAFNESIEVPHVTVSQPEDGQRNIDLEEGNILWNEISPPPFHQTRYEITVKNPDEEIVYEDDISHTGISLGNAELVYSTKYTYTVMPYFLAEDNSKVYPETDPYIYTFYTYAGIVVDEDEVNENNPVSYVKITTPDDAIPSLPVILDNPPTSGYPYQAIAAFRYNFDAVGSYEIQLISSNYLEVTHVYVGGQEMAPFDGSSMENIWAPMGGIVILFNYDGSKGDQNIVLTNDEDATLPVELSSFNAITTADHFAQISWETASESNLLGYNIFRSETENQDDALRVTATMITASNQAMGDSYSYTDDEVEMNTTYNYWLQSNDFDGTSQMFGPVTVKISDQDDHDIDNAILRTELYGNYPNPFNPETTISYSVSQAQHVRLEVYNMRGQLVKTLINEYIASANTRLDVIWNGLDNNNNKVSSGIYLYKLITDNYSKTNKMILMK